MRQGNYEAATEAMREAAELEAKPRTAPHWELRLACGCQDDIEHAVAAAGDAGHSCPTEADYFASLSPAERRSYLAKYEVTAHKEPDGFIAFGMWPRQLIA